jgi:AraC-like DNA-binding protein
MAIAATLRAQVPDFRVLAVKEVHGPSALQPLSLAARRSRLMASCTSGLSPFGALLVRSAFAFVGEGDEPRVAALAGGMSKRTLERWLRGSAGISPGALLRWARVLVGLTFCESTFMPLSRVAYRVGYSTAAAFTRTCRSMLGAPPREFLRARSSALAGPPQREMPPGGIDGGGALRWQFAGSADSWE